MKNPKGYEKDIEEGDEFILVRDLTPEHVGRVFVARNQLNGQGVMGFLEDANAYLLDGVVAIRFFGQPLGIFDRADSQILLKRAGFTHPDLPAPPKRSPGARRPE